MLWPPSRQRLAVLLALLLPSLAGAAEPFEILFVGDVSFAGRRLPRASSGAPIHNPFQHVASRFGKADLVVANGEGLLNNKPPAAYGESRLNIGASPRWAPSYRAAGVDVVGLANNHTWDSGAQGVLENRKHIGSTGVAVYGAGATARQAEAAHRIRGGDGTC
jgi:poly-gamma-glutamate capsule biosynthesis protein CapA/YwtB (metallophosphatase superfamily)